MFFKSRTTRQAASNDRSATPSRPPGMRRNLISVIAEDVNFLGNIISDGTLDFNGKIDGNIRANSVIVRPQGIVNGEIIADSVLVYGRVKGLIRARSTHFFAGCNVEGIIMHEAIAIEDGAIIDGKFKRTNKVTPAQSSAETPMEDMFHDALYEEGFQADYDFETNEFNEDKPGAETPQLLENMRLVAG